MTDRGLFKHCKQPHLYGIGLWATALLFLVSSCATANIRPDTGPESELMPSSLNIKTELSSAEVVAGSMVRLRVQLPTEIRESTLTAEFEGIELPFFAATGKDLGVYDLLLGVPYERKPGEGFISLHVTKGETVKSFKVPLKVVAGNYSSEILHVDGRRVNPTRAKDLVRIKRDLVEVGEIYRRITPQKFWSGPFQFPIQSSVTSEFGTRRLYNGALKNFHTGLDLKAAMNTPVFSAEAGIVALSKNLFFTGNTVMIDHGYGLVTLYAHLSSLKVKKGDVVTAHQLLGLSGKTGRVNGPHLHWQAILHRTKVNPIGLIQVVQ